jgi:hypothetical protein
LHASIESNRRSRLAISFDEAAVRGFGHCLHTKDPRTARLFEVACEAGVDSVHMQAARAVEKAFADAKESLPITRPHVTIGAARIREKATPPRVALQESGFHRTKVAFAKTVTELGSR